MKNKIREIGEGKTQSAAFGSCIIVGKDDAARAVLKQGRFLSI